MAVVATKKLVDCVTNEEVMELLSVNGCTLAEAQQWARDHENASAVTNYYCKAHPETGVISAYGVQRLPISLRARQWFILLGKQPESLGLLGKAVLAFIATYADYLSFAKNEPAKKKVPASMIGPKGKPFRYPKENGRDED